jgi:hypothetical protein
VHWKIVNAILVFEVDKFLHNAEIITVAEKTTYDPANRGLYFVCFGKWKEI